MIQKITQLSKTTKAIIIPNTILNQMAQPEAFDLEIIENKIVLTPLKKKPNDHQEKIFDQSIDLYQID